MSGVCEAGNPPNWIAQVRARLALLRAKKPSTKAGQIRALWPDIEAALAGGQSMKNICDWLEGEAGVTLGFTSLTSYISRIRRRETASLTAQAPTGQSVRSQIRPNILAR